MKARTFALAVTAAVVVWAVAPALAGQPTTLTPGKGVSTANSTGHATVTPPPGNSNVATPGQGTGTALIAPGATHRSPNANAKIGHGIK